MAIRHIEEPYLSYSGGAFNASAKVESLGIRSGHTEEQYQLHFDERLS